MKKIIFSLLIFLFFGNKEARSSGESQDRDRLQVNRLVLRLEQLVEELGGGEEGVRILQEIVNQLHNRLQASHPMDNKPKENEKRSGGGA